MFYLDPNENDYCVDCRVDTILAQEYYMVNSDVWALTGLGTYDGMLCISCLEKRIGRALCSQDFPDLPVNTVPMLRSPLLTKRILNESN